MTGLSSRMMRHLAQTGVIRAVRVGLRCWHYEVRVCSTSARPALRPGSMAPARPWYCEEWAEIVCGPRLRWTLSSRRPSCMPPIRGAT